SSIQAAIPSYRIKAVTQDDAIVTSPDKDEYYPIAYSTLPRDSRIYGIDLLSQPVIGNRLQRARDVNALSAVPDFILHSKDGNVHGFLFSLPVYRRASDPLTVEDRRRDLIGFVHGAFITADVLDQVLQSSTNLSGLNISLFLTDAPP